MDLKQKLNSYQEKQRQLVRDYEEIIKVYESSDFINENIKLKEELADYRFKLQQAQKQLQETLQTNENLKIALKEQILDEKLNILKISKQKLATYFEDQEFAYRNRLLALEEGTKQKLDQLSEVATKSLDQKKSEISAKIAQIASEIDTELYSQRQQFKTGQKETFNDLETRMDGLATEGVSDEVIQKRIKQNQWEMKIGLDWINKIGIILILFGVGFAFQFSYSNFMSNYLKGICFFLLGGLFLGGGEWFYRKHKRIFATGLLGGGISILYCSVFFSFFLLQIIDLKVGLVLSVLITLITLVLSIRYNSKTICSLGLIGGYLPFFTYAFTTGLAVQ